MILFLKGLRDFLSNFLSPILMSHTRCLLLTQLPKEARETIFFWDVFGARISAKNLDMF